jgi:transcriptional regulator with XRE-family HTH domain
MEPLGKRVRKVRRAQDLTQRDLEKLSGIHVVTISRIESGEASRPSAETVRDLAKALQVSADYLLGLKDEVAV